MCRLPKSLARQVMQRQGHGQPIAAATLNDPTCRTGSAQWRVRHCPQTSARKAPQRLLFLHWRERCTQALHSLHQRERCTLSFHSPQKRERCTQSFFLPHLRPASRGPARLRRPHASLLCEAGKLGKLIMIEGGHRRDRSSAMRPIQSLGPGIARTEHAVSAPSLGGRRAPRPS